MCFFVQGVAVSGLALHVEARALLIILASICFILLQLLAIYIIVVASRSTSEIGYQES